MSKTVLQIIEDIKKEGNIKKEKFIEYLLKKYLVDINFFIPVVELIPLLDPEDLAELNDIIKK
jgi:hypothetical protein